MRVAKATLIAGAGIVCISGCGASAEQDALATSDDELPAVAMPFGGAGSGHTAEIAALAAAPAVPIYQGGNLYPNPRVVVVLWTSAVNTLASQAMPNFFGVALDNGWMDWLDEYYSFKAADGPLGRGTYGGMYTINPVNTRTLLTLSAIGAELGTQINASNLPPPVDRNVVYMVYLPAGYTIQTGKTTFSCAKGGFCAIHSSVTQTIQGASRQVVFGAMPDFFNGGCAQPVVCGNGDNVQNLTAASSHELAEITTDPFAGTGWSPEIADGCPIQDMITDSNDETVTVTKLTDRLTDSCITTRPDCQRVSDMYGSMQPPFDFAPFDVQNWWVANSCATAPGPTSTDLCQKASDIFGMQQSDVAFAPIETQYWFDVNNCLTSPRVQKFACARAADAYGIDYDSAGISWGAAPASVRDWYTSNLCTISFERQDSCQKAADMFSILGTSSFGAAPASVRTWWQANGCTAFTSYLAGQQCQNAANYYGIEANVSWGTAPPEAQSWWTAKGCNAAPRCQDLSELWGINAGVTFGYAPTNIQTWWTNNECNSKPLFSANTCQRAADTFGMVRYFTSSHGGSGTPGFAPTNVQSWWLANSCLSYAPRERNRVAFSNGPTP